MGAFDYKCFWDTTGNKKYMESSTPSQQQIGYSREDSWAKSKHWKKPGEKGMTSTISSSLLGESQSTSALRTKTIINTIY